MAYRYQPNLSKPTKNLKQGPSPPKNNTLPQQSSLTQRDHKFKTNKISAQTAIPPPPSTNNQKATIRKLITPTLAQPIHPIDRVLSSKKDPQFVAQYYRQITEYLLRREQKKPKIVHLDRAVIHHIGVRLSMGTEEWLTMRDESISQIISVFADMELWKGLFMCVHLLDLGILKFVQGQILGERIRLDGQRIVWRDDPRKHEEPANNKTKKCNGYPQTEQSRLKYFLRRRQLDKIFITSIFTSTKNCDIYPPSYQDLEDIFSTNIFLTEIVHQEKEMLEAMDYKMEHTSEDDFLHHFLTVLDFDREKQAYCEELLMAGLFNPELWFERPSLKACGVVFLCLYKRELKGDESYPEVLEALTNHRLDEIKRVAKMYQQALLLAQTNRRMDIIQFYLQQKVAKRQ